MIDPQKMFYPFLMIGIASIEHAQNWHGVFQWCFVPIATAVEIVSYKQRLNLIINGHCPWYRFG